MTSIMLDKLPHDVVRKIIELLPLYLIYKLLKSKILAPLAYDIYYKHVYIQPEQPPDFPLRLQWNHKEVTAKWTTIIAPDYIVKEDDEFDMSISGAHVSFPSGASFVSFCKRHSLFKPHTLYYSQMVQLETIHKAMPGYLQKFKYLSKWGCAYDKEVKPSFKFKELKHNLFEFAEEVKLIPNHIEKLKLDGVILKKSPSPMVKSLTIHQRYNRRFFGINWKHLTSKGYPGLQDLNIEEMYEGPVCLDFPSLNSLKIFIKGDAKLDLSRCVNLKHCRIAGVNSQTIGLSGSDDVRLPPSLETFSVLYLYQNHQLKQLYKLTHLRKLSFTIWVEPEDLDLSGLRLPPNLRELSIKSENDFIWPDCEVPRSLRRVQISALDQKVNLQAFPDDTQVDMLDVIEAQLDKKFLGNSNELLGLSCRIGKDFDGEFPSCLQKLQLADYCGIGSFNKLKNLTTLKHVFEIDTFLDSYVLPPSVTDLTLVNASTGVKNFEGLVKLSLDSCDVDLKFGEMKNLQLLELKKHKEVDLNCLPDSLETLIVYDTKPIGGFVCPKGLKYLEMEDCKLQDGLLKLNSFLEVLYLTRTDCKWNETFKDAGKYMKGIHMEYDYVVKISADLTDTGLEYFFLKSMVFDRSNMKFPESLLRLTIRDCSEDDEW